MKRTELKRKTPMPRPTKPLRRVGRLKARSRKRAKQDRESDHRPQFLREFSGCVCWYCGIRKATDTDHILGRNHKLRHHRTNLARACSLCNCHLKVSTMESRERWKRIKMEMDPDGFDAEIWTQLVKSFNGSKA